ncbi:hypothetical protein QQS21_005667 [Conoideocrella luteorostrata]|uniref:Peptidase S1 domain-containing protein n=1 Tax=Conoideocrella luteorostrata TaxID=1105319 RepID=A0AAJ0FTL4_9HYPO|nr:hypothetical protein QQS21_005667 [Conoideocrella luteorostrata]
MVLKNAFAIAAAFYAVSAALPTVDKRIVGGESAKDGEFPFIVHINDGWNSPTCGGVLLDSTTVLTGGHCIGIAASVWAGLNDQGTGGVGSAVISRKRHPRYKVIPLVGAVNDIGILKLRTPIEKNDTIGYATLPAKESDPAVNSTAVAAGWGAITATKNLKDVHSVETLNKVTIPVHAREDCAKLRKELVGIDTLVCAGGAGKNVCKGDSGGPLIDQDTKQVIGIASFAIKDTADNYCGQAPSVYTRVGSYISFIQENLAQPKSQSPSKSSADPRPADARSK